MPRRRTCGRFHQVTRIGSETGAGPDGGGGAGMEAIALQPSGACGRLPAAEAPRTIPRHAGSLHGTRVARLRAPRYGARPAPPRGRAAHGVLRVRPDRTQPATGQPDAADAAPAFSAARA